MASIKVKFRPSQKDGMEGTIYYQVLHQRVPRQISTHYRIRHTEWDADKSIVVNSGKGREAYIRSVREHIHSDVDRLQRIIRKKTSLMVDFTTDDIVEEFRRYSKEYSFINYMELTIVKLVQNGKLGTAENYRSALNSFKKFLATTSQEESKLIADDILLDNFTSDLMERYEAWHRKQGHVSNTISFYIRIFRAVHKRAVDENIIEDSRPFKRVYTGIDKTEKRALPLDTIRKVKSLNLMDNPKLMLARDVFLLSFYLRGMSIIDLCFLLKTDLKGGTLTYRRRKTGQQLTIAWTKEMQQILDKYPENESKFLLPIITKSTINEKWAYKNLSYQINRDLKKIGQMVGSPESERWSLYYARHTWASLARANGIPLSVISEAMGHENERTTQIYLASLDTMAVDKANDLVISLI